MFSLEALSSYEARKTCLQVFVQQVKTKTKSLGAKEDLDTLFKSKGSC